MRTNNIRVASILLAAIAVLIVGSSAAAQSPGEWRSSAWHLWRIDVDGTNLKPVDTTPDSQCGSPDWSPDGQSIVYDVLPDGQSTYHVAVIRADGTDRRVISTRGSIPSWSPDGTQICFQGDGIQIMNVDGTGRESLPARAWSLRWSPRGNVIASSPGGSIVLYDLATGQSQEIFATPHTISHGYGISLDGLRFCYGTPGDGLWVATLDERTMRATTRQVVKTGIAYHASWAPDGKRVVYAWRATPDDKTQLYTLDVDDNEPPQLLPGIDTSHQNVNPDWSPDGKTIVFSAEAPLTVPAN